MTVTLLRSDVGAGHLYALGSDRHLALLEPRLGGGHLHYCPHIAIIDLRRQDFGPDGSSGRTRSRECRELTPDTGFVFRRQDFFTRRAFLSAKLFGGGPDGTMSP